jgi:hypothetical protein
MFIGIAIVIIGLVFLLQALGLISGSSWAIIWPCIIIIVGAGIICKERGNCCCGDDCKKEKK